MPIPHDPRVRAVLEAVASVIAAFDVEDYSDAILAEAEGLRRAAVREFPGHTADAIRTFAAAGIRTDEDARFDPQPGDTNRMLDGWIAEVVVRYDDIVIFRMDSTTHSTRVADWSKRDGTFTPAAP